MKFRAADIAAATGGSLHGPDRTIDGATIDSRAVRAGELFVPIIAERDGHDFIASAVAGGAAAVLSDRLFATADSPNSPAIVQVDNTSVALQALAVAARARIDAPLVGVTGSVGKTSAKDLILAACGKVRKTHANPGSFNNELGLPLTLINTPDGAELVVTEMGARGLGHVADLCEIARPTIGVVTRVAGAHTELFGSLEAIAEAKGELIAALPAEGTAILNADDDRVLAMADRARCPVMTFGLAEGADVRISDLTLDAAAKPTFTVTCPAAGSPPEPTTSGGERPQQVARVSLPISGAHMALNAAAAVAVGIAVGIELAELVAGLEQAEVSPHRMSLLTTASGATVINDAYNANPTSMRAALEALAALGVERRTAVLGTMAELGEDGEAEHGAIANEAAAAGVRVIAVATPAYGQAATHVASLDEAAELLAGIGPDDGVLVKGSRVAELEHLVTKLEVAR